MTNKAWNIWVEYCRKLDKWYKANPEKAAEYEPTLMTPPFDAIVESNLSAEAELNRLIACDEVWREKKRVLENDLGKAWKENSRLREALETIADPIGYLHREANKTGGILNGVVAIQLSEDSNWLKGIAVDALRRAGGTNGL